MTSDAPSHGEEDRKPLPRQEEKRDLEPIDLEPRPEPEPPRPPSRALALEKRTCPECGAPMEPGEEACIRCGLIERDDDPEPSPATAAPPKDEPTPAGQRAIAALGRSPRLEFGLPLAVGGISLIILIIAHLAGAIGLFPHLRLEEEFAVPGWGDRFSELLRTIVLLLFWTGCGLAGLFGLGATFERPLGDARLAAARIAAITATIRLAALLSIPGPLWVEWMVESILQGVGFIALAMLFFRLVLREAAILAGWTLMAILTLWLFTYAVQWALSG